MTKIKEKSLDKLHSNLHCFDALLAQKRQENIETLRSFMHVFSYNSPSNQMSCHGYFGNWKTFLTISLSIYLMNIDSDSPSTVDKESFKEVLKGILKVRRLILLV